jgi:hypothetical protein
LASEGINGVVEGEASDLAFRLRLTESEVQDGLNGLLSIGYITRYQDASAMLAPCKQETRLETETEGEKETKEEGEGEAPRPPVLRYTYQQVMQAADAVVMKQEDAESFYAHYAAVDFIDGAGRKITSLPHALAKWKANPYGHGKGKDGAVVGARRFPDTPQALKLKIEAAEHEIRAMPSYHQDRTEAHCKRIDELKRKIKEWHNAMVE